jgi:uridine kinase
MLGDVLLIGEMHKRAATDIGSIVLHEIDQKRETDPDYKYIVSISGESGAGKSELSHSLASYLKKFDHRIKILHTDNYYKISPLLRNEWRKNKGLKTIGIDEYDWTLINKNIQEFKENRESMLPCIDIISGQIDKLITDFEKVDILVVDGLYAINIIDSDKRIFIDLTYHETKISQISRGKEMMNEWRNVVLEHEHVAVRSLRDKADIIVNKAYQVEII